MIHRCIGCGCDEWRACFDEKTGQPCSWLAVDDDGTGVCSCCGEYLARWQDGFREFQVPVDDGGIVED